MSCPSKSLNYMGINLLPQKFSTLTMAKFTVSTKTDITLQTNVKKMRAIIMCRSFTTDYGYHNSLIEQFGNVYRPNTMCSDIIYLHKKTLQALERNGYHCPHCLSTCQVRNIPFEEHTNSFFLEFGQEIFIFEETKKPFQDVIGDMYCPTCPNEKCVYLSNNKNSSFFDSKKCETRSHVVNFPFKDQKPTNMLFGSDGTIALRKTSHDYEKEKPSPFLEKFLRHSQSSTPDPEPKKAKIILFMA